ncbi:MAG: DUF4276 family protein [Candidatus Electronema sp. V4]|uniref:DUF4276 family protein n=1 Tax=Candidatus Electronema sp. V4 TaxID=3454756 RepID=UPI0040559A27
MARLYLFAEGQTEQTFADTVLKPHLATVGVFMQGPVLIAHAKKKGKIHRGGAFKYAPVKNDIARFFAQEKDDDVFFTTMIDLYALPDDFPQWNKAKKLSQSPAERVKLLEQSFADDLGDLRFIPYIQLHEYEAYLFAGPEQFAFFYPQNHKAVAALQAVAGGFSSPELIDDGPETAPSKRIIAELPDYKYAKSVIGPQVAELIGLDAIRKKCPHFNAWLSRLEQLGR